MSEIKAETGDFELIEDLCMNEFELTESIWNELSKKAKEVFIEVYMKQMRAGKAGQPDQERFCEHKKIVEGRVVECDRPSIYRVSKYSEREFLKTDTDKMEWEKERHEEYLCEDHFKRKYWYNEEITSKDLGKWSYKIFKTKIKKEEIELRIKARK